MQPLAVVILTLNEASNIAKAIVSVEARVPVVVLDSGSTDRTAAIARALGAELIEREFDDYASQRNYALQQLRERYEWVFFLDADEEFTPALWRDIEQCLQGRAPRLDGAYVGYTFCVLGHELRYGGFGSASVLRLMRPQRARFSRGTNERVDDRSLRVTTLRHKLRHADAKPVAAWFHKHVAYAEREARHYLDGEDHRRGLDGAGLATKAGRTVAIRWAYNQLPLFVRPFANFARTVVAQSAWRDGMPGVLFAGMQSLWYPMMIDLMIYEAKQQRPQEQQHAA